jgi:hypothetical protein
VLCTCMRTSNQDASAGRAAEQRDELAPPLSVTSSARPSKAWDMRPSVFGFEVISSTFVDC